MTSVNSTHNPPILHWMLNPRTNEVGIRRLNPRRHQLHLQAIAHAKLA
jgi:hypothetical protein